MSAVLLGVVGAAAAGAAVLASHMVFVQQRDLRVTRIEVPVPALGAAFDGYTIAVLADLHHWPAAGLRLVDRAVAAANAARPDAIALLGDYSVSGRVVTAFNRLAYERAMPALAPALRRLGARDGVFGVLGNHDHYHDGAAVTVWLRSCGVRPLVNGAATIRRGDDALVLCGVDDTNVGRPDIDAALADADPHAPVVLLTHNPDGVLDVAPRHRVALALAGHTHGGQYVFPLFGPPTAHARVCTRAQPAGWIDNAHARLFVSRGVGVQVPGRLNCPPEVVIAVLRRARPAA